MTKIYKPGVKERILTTAAKLFYFEGYNQTGINQIISEAKVAKASMYQHFRSKEDIAVAYLQERHEMWVNNLLSFIGSEKIGKNRIIKSFDYLDEWLNEVGFRGCGFQNIITDLPRNQHKITEVVVFHKQELTAWIVEMLQVEKKYNTSQVRQLSEEIMVLFEGAIMLSQINKCNVPILAARRTCQLLLSQC